MSVIGEIEVNKNNPCLQGVYILVEKQDNDQAKYVKKQLGRKAKQERGIKEGGGMGKEELRRRRY